jgi:sulfite exporter TauE/SafE
MAFDFFIQPVLTGLSVGAFCMSYCFPFLATFIASEDRPAKRNLGLICYFMLGRFFGYVAFGLVFGFLGEQLKSPFLTFITDLSLILVSVVMILHITGLSKQKDNLCLVHLTRSTPAMKNPPAVEARGNIAIVMGFLMGVNICPPFLLSLAYVVSLKDILQSVLYFVIFFIASSIYFLPMLFVGMMAKIKELRKTAQGAGIMAACVFIIYGGYSIIKYFIIRS